MTPIAVDLMRLKIMLAGMNSMKTTLWVPPKWAYRASGALLFIVSVWAAHQVGWVSGWLTGASRSPVAPVIAPSIFGLLTSVVALTYAREILTRTDKLIYGACAAAVIGVACMSFHSGVIWGIHSRVGPYKTFAVLVGDCAWSAVDPNTAARLHKFRVSCRVSGMSYREFEPIIRDVVRPLVTSKDPDKLAKLDSALSIIESDLNTTNRQVAMR